MGGPAATPVDGPMVNVGAPAEPVQLNILPLLLGRRSLAGSAIGGIRETQEMLDYCAEHGVAAEIELVTGDRINESWESVLSQDVRYRYVLDTGTLAQGSRSEAKVRSITDRSSTR